MAVIKFINSTMLAICHKNVLPHFHKPILWVMGVKGIARRSICVTGIPLHDYSHKSNNMRLTSRHYSNSSNAPIYLDTKDQSIMLPVIVKDPYITDQLRKKENFKLDGKLHISTACPSCKKETARFIAENSYNSGTVIVRCSNCKTLCVLADHLNIITTSRDLCSSLHSAQKAHNIVRLDKDTVEVTILGDDVGMNSSPSPQATDDAAEDDYVEDAEQDDVEDEETHIKHLQQLRENEENDGIRDVSQCIDQYYANNNICHVQPDTDVYISNKRRVDMLIYEYSMWKFTGHRRIPDRVSEFHWLRLIQVSTAQRLKYHNYVFKTEKLIESEVESKALKRIQNRADRQQCIDRSKVGEIAYGIGCNTIFRRLGRRYLDTSNHSWRAHGYLFGPEIPYDLGYEGDMSERELLRCVMQLHQAYGWNSHQREAARILFTNVPPTGLLHHMLSHYILRPGRPGSRESHHFIDITSHHVLDLYPPESIVILSPDARTMMPDKYDGETKYVINGIVDLGCNMPLALANAKQMKLRSQQFPFDKYLTWTQGGKNLPIDVCHRILQTWMVTSSWEEAFQHVPTRKLRPQPEERGTSELRRARRLGRAVDTLQGGYEGPLATLQEY